MIVGYCSVSIDEILSRHLSLSLGKDEVADLGHEPVDVAGPDGEQHLLRVGGEVGNQLVFGQDSLVGVGDEREQMLGGDAGNRLLAGRVDGQQDDLVELGEYLGEGLLKVAGAAVEVWLEDARDGFAWVYFAHGGDEGVHLLGVVRVVVDENMAAVVHDIVEAAFHAGEGVELFAQDVRREHALELAARAGLFGQGGDGGSGVEHVVEPVGVQLQTGKGAVRGAQVEGGAVGLQHNVVGVVVRGGLGAVHALARMGDFAGNLLLDEQRARLEGELLEGGHKVVEGAIDVEMVGIHCSDDGRGGVEREEGTVVLVGLGHGHHRVRVEHEVVVEVLGDAADEGRHRHLRVQQVSDHRGGGGFAVGAGHRDGGHPLGQVPKHLRPLVDGDIVLYEILVLRVLRTHGRGVHHKVDVGGNLLAVFVVMDNGPFARQHLGDRGGGEVVAINVRPFRNEVLGQGTHSDASDAEEVYRFIFHR